MKSLSLARVLPVLESSDGPKFTPPRLETPRPGLHIVAPSPESLSPEVIVEAMPEPVAEPVIEPTRDRFMEGYEAGLAEARAQAEAEAEERMEAEQRALDGARKQWAEEEGERIAAGVVKALAAIENELGDVAARILAKIAKQSVRERALAQFTEAVSTLLRNGEAGVVTVHAPDDLIRALETRLSDIGAIEFVAHAQPEVWVRSGPTRIETRLARWEGDFFGGELA